MQDLEPPEVPLELVPQANPVEPKKGGFFSKLFSRKKSAPEIQESGPGIPDTELPALDARQIPSGNDAFDLNKDIDNINNMINTETAELGSALPELPAMDPEPQANAAGETKLKNKSKGKAKKGQSRKMSKIDESSKFDWSREIDEQEILIHDNARFNQDVNKLIGDADKHIDDKMQSVAEDAFKSQHNAIEQPATSMEIPEFNALLPPIPEAAAGTTPEVDMAQHKGFVKISMSHQRLRSTLERYLKNKKAFNDKAKIMGLFKAYDESIEKTIEDKELELSHKKSQVAAYERQLKGKEQEVRRVLRNIKGLDDKLRLREENINNIISKTVEKELARRLKSEKASLKEELHKTVALNTELKKKVKIIEDDRKKFESEHNRMSETERKKLNNLQSMYEKKLQELQADRKEFEDKRKAAMEVLKHAMPVVKELEELKRVKAYVEEGKKTVEKELSEDKELKTAIDKAEEALTHERENLDNIIFKKYIENKLKGIKPEYLENKQDWKAEMRSNPLYGQIDQCRAMLRQHDLNNAKAKYNNIRKSYEDVKMLPRKEKEALYNAIRELYNDIQLNIVEAQMRVKQR